jgi:hypothetical protein
MGLIMLALGRSCLAVAETRHELKYTPMRRRGPNAWQNFAKVDYGDFSTPNRLHVHSVDDSSNPTYTREVALFLMDVKMRQINISTVDRLDNALARDLEFRCFGLQQNVQRGKSLLHGMHHVFPHIKGKLVRALKALHGWEKIHIPGEGRPMSRSAVFAVVSWFLKNGHTWEAVCAWLSWDCFLRESDWESVRLEDIFVVGEIFGSSAPQVTLRLGTAHRGLSTKTGPNHMVIVDSPLLRRILALLKEAGEPGDPLFCFRQHAFRLLWHKALHKLGIEPLPPHTLRHSRPAHLIWTGEASLEEVRRRGRWRQLKSVQRYTKTGQLLMFESMMPKEVDQAGRAFVLDIPNGLLSAVKGRAGAKTVGDRIVLAAAQAELPGPAPKPRWQRVRTHK